MTFGTGQDRTGQDRTGQDRPGQNKTIVFRVEEDVKLKVAEPDSTMSEPALIHQVHMPLYLTSEVKGVKS